MLQPPRSALLLNRLCSNHHFHAKKVRRSQLLLGKVQPTSSLLLCATCKLNLAVSTTNSFMLVPSLPCPLRRLSSVGDLSPFFRFSWPRSISSSTLVPGPVRAQKSLRLRLLPVRRPMLPDVRL